MKLKDILEGEFENLGADGDGDYVFRNLVAQANAQHLASAGIRKKKPAKKRKSMGKRS